MAWGLGSWTSPSLRPWAEGLKFLELSFCNPPPIPTGRWGSGWDETRKIQGKKRLFPLFLHF